MGDPIASDDDKPESSETPNRPSGVRAPAPRTTARVGVDGWVPARTAKEAPADLDLRLAFLLLHADGKTSVKDIALTVQREPLDVLGSFVELAALGLVDLTANPATTPPPSSTNR
jgi:hypothetical protein